MIIYNGKAYATQQGDEGETLAKIKRDKNGVRYFITNERGFGFNRYGVPFQFSKLSNGRFWYQHTFDADKETFTAEYNKEKLDSWYNNICII